MEKLSQWHLAYIFIHHQPSSEECGMAHFISPCFYPRGNAMRELRLKGRATGLGHRSSSRAKWRFELGSSRLDTLLISPPLAHLEISSNCRTLNPPAIITLFILFAVWNWRRAQTGSCAIFLKHLGRQAGSWSLLENLMMDLLDYNSLEWNGPVNKVNDPIRRGGDKAPSISIISGSWS